MSETLVLFDVDGTLVDVAGAGRAAVHAAFVDVFGVPADRVAETAVPFAGRTDVAIFAAIGEALGIPPARYAARSAALVEAYCRRLHTAMGTPDPRRRVLPGVRTLLESLRGRPDALLGLITGNVERGARIKLDAFDLNRYFETGGFASDDGSRERIARRAAEKVAALHGVTVEPPRTVVVGDTVLDVECARANGFRAIAVGTGGADDETMASWGPDARFEDLADLAAVLGAIGLADGVPGTAAVPGRPGADGPIRS